MVLSADEYLCWQDEPYKFMYRVASGLVMAVHTSDDGDEQVLRIAGQGDYIGNLAGHTSMPYDLRAFTDVVLRPVDRNEVDLLAIMTREYEWSHEHRILLMTGDAKQKVATAILLVSELIETTSSIPFQREKMSFFLDLSLETVSRNVSKLVKEEVIEVFLYQGVNIINWEALSELSLLERFQEQDAPRVAA